MMAYLKKIADMARRIALAGMMVMGAAVAAGAEPGLRLHYDRPAQYFEEALVIGNGRIGAAIYGGTSDVRLFLCSKIEDSHHQFCLQPFPNVVVYTKINISTLVI